MTHRKSPFQSDLRNKTVNDSMEFNLLDLHDPEDTELRKCIRAYTVIPKYAAKPDIKNHKAQKIVNILKRVNTKLNIEIGFEWKVEFREKFPFPVAKETLNDWLAGRVSIPLIAIVELVNFGCQEEVEEIKQYLEYFTSATGKVARIPKQVTPDLAWLSAAIMCDGHLRKTKKKIYFEVTDRNLVKKFRDTFCRIFQLPEQNLEVYNRPQSVKTLIRYAARNMPAVHFLHKFFEIPAGKKCDIIEVPTIIRHSSLEIKKSFLKGVFDTDGGKRGGGLGLTSASKRFRDQISYLLTDFGIKAKNDDWINKLYNKKYYGLRFRKDERSSFLCTGTEAAKRIRFRSLISQLGFLF